MEPINTKSDVQLTYANSASTSTTKKAGITQALIILYKGLVVRPNRTVLNQVRTLTLLWEFSIFNKFPLTKI